MTRHTIPPKGLLLASSHEPAFLALGVTWPVLRTVRPRKYRLSNSATVVVSALFREAHSPWSISNSMDRTHRTAAARVGKDLDCAG